MKYFKYITSTILAVIAALSIPSVFIYSNVISSYLDKFLQLEIAPVLTGGEVIARISDPVADDYGEGNLIYPGHRDFSKKGILDIVRYTVHAPLADSVWSNLPAYWQIDITFLEVDPDDNNRLNQAVVHLYIDLDGKQSGSVGTLLPRCELVTFDPEHPWDLMIHVDGQNEKGTLYNSKGDKIDSVDVYFLPEKKTVILRIPLRTETIEKVLDGRDTYHYVMVDAWDP